MTSAGVLESAGLGEVLASLLLERDGKVLFEGRTVARPDQLVIGAISPDPTSAPMVYEIDAPPVPRCGVPVSGFGGDAVGRTLVERYFEHLESGQAEQAAACFSPDVVYSIPPRAGETRRGLVVGRESLVASFRARGVNAARHHASRVAGDGAGRFLVEGLVSGLGPRDTPFMSSVWVDVHGLICRYIALLKLPLPVVADGKTS
jgi:hypothetical protein